MTPMTRKAVAQEVLKCHGFNEELALIAQKRGQSIIEARKEAYLALRKLVSVQIPFFEFLLNRGLGSLHTRAWSLDVDWTALKHLREENVHKRLIFLPTHRSYSDSFILTQILQSVNMPQNYILGGDNLAFFPLSTIGRRSGAVFIRRNFKDDEVYKLAVRKYLQYLIHQGANLEWYMEGGRSRTGKLRAPRYGLLKYLINAIDDGGVKDILLIPVSITYDQLHEVGKMVAEAKGKTKEKEGFRWFASYIKSQKTKEGKAYVRFGQTFSLREATKPNNYRWTIDKIAFEIFQRINQVTPVTAPALVTITLLSVHDHALTLQEVHKIVKPLLDYAAHRNLPTTALGCLDNICDIEEVLNNLIRSGVVACFKGGLLPVYYILPGKHSVAAYYRNSAIHWFVNRAIVEIGIMAASHDKTNDAITRGLEQAFALRDLLKFEFIFSEKAIFEEEIKKEARLIDPDRQALVPGQRVSESILEKTPFLIAHRVLPAFLEAYFIVADQLTMHSIEEPVIESTFLMHCLDVGRQYVLQKRLRNPECISLELFKNALALAANRTLLQSGSKQLADKRQQFAEETAAALAAVAEIGELDYRLQYQRSL